MVARLNSSKRMLSILNYNENKVTEGQAKCILENSFGCPVEKLNFYNKIHKFESFMKRNRRATTKAVHISLNFHPDEKLSEKTLKEIAVDYMTGIGFSLQPYLVYQHFDAGHPHIHIVTTNIQKDGKRIILHNIGRNQSEKTRKRIEMEYGLIKASGQKRDVPEAKQALEARKLVYGKSEIKRSISNVLRSVMRNYRYTSLPELNAVLSQFNIVADRGSEKSRMFSKGGLHYRVTDQSGRKVGVPIKASAISGKPTLSFLEKQFKLNEALRKQHKAQLIERINNAFGNKYTIKGSAFVRALNSDNISVLFRQNDEGRIYGITFVDNKNKVVFNGSHLGKAYSAKAITDRLTGLSKPDRLQVQTSAISQSLPSRDTSLWPDDTLKDLTTAQPYDFSSPDAALRRHRKRRRKGRSL